MSSSRFSDLPKTLTLALSAVLGLMVALFLILWVVARILLVGKDHPSDAELRSLLRDHRTEIDSLVRMIRTDRMDVVADDWIRPDSGMTPERWDLYRELLDRLEVESGIRLYNDTTVELWISTQGLTTGGSSKGLVLRPRDPAPLLEHLDSRPPGKNNGIGYTKLWDGWYICYEWDN